jgi:hypothetical protein
VTSANEAGSEVVMSMSLVGSSIPDNGFSTTADFAAPTGYKVQLFLVNGSGGTAATPSGRRGNTRRRMAWSAMPMSMLSANATKLTKSDQTRRDTAKNRIRIVNVISP